MICFAAAIRFLSFIGLSRWIVDQIDLALLTLRFLARVQILRESTQLFRCAPRLPHDTSYLSCAGSQRRCGRSLSAASPATKKGRCRLHGGASGSGAVRHAGRTVRRSHAGRRRVPRGGRSSGRSSKSSSFHSRDGRLAKASLRISWDSRRCLSVVPGHPAQRPPDQAAEDDRAVAKRVAESP